MIVCKFVKINIMVMIHDKMVYMHVIMYQLNLVIRILKLLCQAFFVDNKDLLEVRLEENHNYLEGQWELRKITISLEVRASKKTTITLAV